MGGERAKRRQIFGGPSSIEADVCNQVSELFHIAILFNTTYKLEDVHTSPQRQSQHGMLLPKNTSIRIFFRDCATFGRVTEIWQKKPTFGFQLLVLQWMSLFLSLKILQNKHLLAEIDRDTAKNRPNFMVRFV